MEGGMRQPLLGLQRPGAAAVVRHESIYCGNAEAYADLRRRRNWTEKLQSLESLDYEVIDNKRFRQTGRHTAKVAKWVITAVIGTLVGVLAFCIELAVDAVARARLRAMLWAIELTVAADGADADTDSHPLRGIGDLVPAWLVMMSSGAVLAFAASLLVVRVAPAATGAGVALVMANLNGIHVPKLLAMETMLVKVVGTVFSVASGLPVGPEGPLVHIGAGVASFCTRQQRVRFRGRTVFSTHDHKWLDTFHNDGDRRDFLSAGVASGLAAAFGAPIGGVLFSLEEASTFWSHDTTWRSLLCSTLSIFTLSLLHTLTAAASASRPRSTLLSIAAPGLISFGDGGYGADTTASFFVWELPIFIALAAAAGVIGAALTHASAHLAPHRPKTPVLRVVEAAAAAAACVTLALVVSHLFGSCRPVPHTGLSVTSREEGPERDTWGEAVAVRLLCPKGHFNDLATLLLGLRDDIIAKVLSVGGSDSACAGSPGNSTGTAGIAGNSTSRAAAAAGSGSSSGRSEADESCPSHFPFSPWSVFVALVVTLATMVLACDLSLPAGMFMPTILWGALLGSLFGFAARSLAAYMLDDPLAAANVAPGTYALVGSTAALAGVFRSSISLVVIMLEGTGHVGFLVPLLVGVAVANLTGNFINGDSFYEEQLRAKGIPFLHHHDATAPCTAEPHASTVVATCMSAPVVCLHPNESVGRIEWVLRNTQHNGFPVVTRDQKSHPVSNDTPSVAPGYRRVPSNSVSAAEGVRGGGGGEGQGGGSGDLDSSSASTTVPRVFTWSEDSIHATAADASGVHRRVAAASAAEVGHTGAASDGEGVEGEAAGGGGHLIGIVLRSQLMVLLARRAFIELVASPPAVSVWRFPPFGYYPLMSPPDTTEAKFAAAQGDTLDEFLLPGGRVVVGSGGGGVSARTAAGTRLRRAVRGVTGFFQDVKSRTLGSWETPDAEGGAAEKENGLGDASQEEVVAGSNPGGGRGNVNTFVSRNSSLHSLLPDDDASDDRGVVRDGAQDDASRLLSMVRRWDEGSGDGVVDGSAVLSSDRLGDRDPACSGADEVSDEQRALDAYYDALDTDMRTFHHRESFHDRSISVSDEAVARLGLTHAERDMHCDLASFMKIAPLSVQSQCSAWRALGYFRSMGLRHLPVVDETNMVVGMLTRADLIPHIRAAAAEAAIAATATAAAASGADDGGEADDLYTASGRAVGPPISSTGPRRVLTGGDLYQTVHL